MKVCENVYQIRIDFYVTPEIKRYVYVYLITGKYCYLIDTGVNGSEKIIGEYMEKIGRDISEIKAIFLTHAHPDHIGAAAAIKKVSGCEIYASEMEKPWIENIDLQFSERPVPNFYTLVKEGVKVDNIVKEKDSIILESGITLKVMETAGHSKELITYIFEDEKVMFCGDTIPVDKEFPFPIDVSKTKESIKKIQVQKDNIALCCPAWDRIYMKEELEDICRERINLLSEY